MNAAGLTDVGKMRNKNEDAIAISLTPIGGLPNLFIVADGMGGHNAGEIASTFAIEYVINYVEKSQKIESTLQTLAEAIQHASSAIYVEAEANRRLRGMGTTTIACVVDKKEAFFAHVGDSRAYAIYDAAIKQLTVDHTYVEELFRSGRITEQEARTHAKRHMITRSVGSYGKCEVDRISLDLDGVRQIIICSDGLTNFVTDERIMELAQGTAPTKALVDEANNNGGADNISVIVIDIGQVSTE